MRSVSPRFLAALVRAHRVAWGISVLTTDGDEIALDASISGSVILDATADSRGSLDLTIADDGELGLVPAAAADLLAPYGNEIRVQRGILFSDGPELVSLGVFRIDEADVNDSGDSLSIAITGLDRSATIIDAKFDAPYKVAGGTLFTDAIAAVILDANPAATMNFIASDLTTPILVADTGEDRWAFARDMALAMGCELYFDGDGVLVLRPAPAGSPVATIAEGENGVLVEAGRRMSRENVRNRWVVTGENTTNSGAPARGEAIDDDPESPTYYYGPFGKVSDSYTSEFIVTDEQAQDAAEALLAKNLGASQSVRFGAFVNPALEPSDVVRVTRQRAKIDEDHVIDRLTIPLDVGTSMRGETRAITTAGS